MNTELIYIIMVVFFAVGVGAFMFLKADKAQQDAILKALTENMSKFVDKATEEKEEETEKGEE